jgi:chemotaxis protein methyltransferase CheR
LRVLQDGEFERLGSSRTKRVDVRLIAATNHDLDATVEKGTFRRDLYYRLSVYPIVLPPLRERREDIPLLTHAFMARHQQRLRRRNLRVPRVVMEALQAYDWPGNVRELQNVLERAMIRSTGVALELDGTFDAGRRKPGAHSGDRRLATLERTHIEAVLAECRWKINGPGNAAERLGLHPSTLRFRMRGLGVVRPPRVSR